MDKECSAYFNRVWDAICFYSERTICEKEFQHSVSLNSEDFKPSQESTSFDLKPMYRRKSKKVEDY